MIFFIETVNCLTERGKKIFLPTNWQIMSIYSVGQTKPSWSC